MSIDLQEIEAELNSVRCKISDWSASSGKFVLEGKDQYAVFLSDQIDKLKSLHGRKAQLQVQALQTKKRLQDEEERVRRTEERLAEANSIAGTSERHLEVSEAQLRRKQEEYRQKVEDLERENKERNQQLDNLRTQAALFNERFGLRFRTDAQGDFTVVMTYIDPQDHNKEFSFSVRMAPNDVYTVTKCEPLVPDLDALVNQVNQTNDFAAFVKAVRAHFVTIARQS